MDFPPSTARYFFFEELFEELFEDFFAPPFFEADLLAVLFFEAVDFFDAVRLVLDDFFEPVDFFDDAVFFEEEDFFEPVDFFDEEDFFDDDFFDDDFGSGGTLPPSRRASDSPMAMVCLRLVTFLPEPLRSFPRFSSCIVFSTLSCDFFP